jgi:hypothetical protein
MRTLLRNTTTGLYLQGDGKWTDNPESALDFRFIDRALSYVNTWKLRQMEVAFAFEDLPEITSVPLERVSLRFSAE